MRKSAANADVLSTREAAERLGVALRTVQLWVEGGVLPAWKTAGGHRRISRAAVEKLIAERNHALLGRSGEADAGAVEGLAGGGERPLKVLVVEDDPDMLKLICMVIEGWDLPMQLRTATNGFEALLRIGDDSPDLLLTDLNMPGMDGFRMIAALQRHQQGQQAGGAPLRVVVATALTPAEIELRGGLPSAVHVFTKPLPFDELEALMREQHAALAAAALQ
jgi:excisionase family DNA binding protein